MRKMQIEKWFFIRTQSYIKLRAYIYVYTYIAYVSLRQEENVEW